MKVKQPSLFISHGTIYEAFKSEQLKRDFEISNGQIVGTVDNSYFELSI